MILITNKKDGKSDSDTFYCGRGSPVGNPFKLTYPDTEESRNKVIEKYKIWINCKISENDKDIIRYLEKMNEHHIKYGIVKLECYCHPKRCHCEIIRDILKDKFFEYPHEQFS